MQGPIMQNGFRPMFRRLLLKRFGEAGAVEELHRARRRHEGRVIEVQAEELALGREHADDAETLPAQAQAPAEAKLAISFRKLAAA